jgi:NTE family protein
MLMAKNVHGEPQPYLPGRRWIDGSVADDLPAKRLSRLFGTNHYIVSMVNPIATAFLAKDEKKSVLRSAAGSLGVGVGREVLNFYRGIAQKYGDNWPRFNMALHGLHALMDQEYSGDINIVPSFRIANPLRLLSHLDESELLEIIQYGERACFEKVESIRRCTMISRTLEDILYRFEYGDLRPDPKKIHRPRSSRRRPPPTKAQLERLTKSVPAKASAKKAAVGSKSGSRSASVVTH